MFIWNWIKKKIDKWKYKRKLKAKMKKLQDEDPYIYD
tara:strand:+ start:4097 stop:4207 length:111 start_codon:yes stop_codon:yes gene_type:complete